MKNQKLTKLKDAIFSNIPLKILAVIIAAVAWIVITNVSDPSKKIAIDNINVTLKNVQSLSDKGYIYEKTDGKISINVKGPQSVVDSLDETDFEAYVDFDQYKEDLDYVEISINCIDEDAAKDIKITTPKDSDNKLYIYKKVDKELPIDIIFSGALDSGYVVGDYGISRNVVAISGMENIVNRIKTASISLDLTTIDEGVSKEVVEKIEIDFYDVNGNKVDVSSLDISLSDVTLHMDILQEKWLTVNYTVTGEPAEGYSNRGSEANLKTVKVVASDFTSGTTIQLPSGTIDITGLDADKKFSIDLKQYLPSGYTITSSITTLEVTVDVEKYVTNTISVPVEKIKITGLNNDYQYEITTVDNRNVLYVGVKGYEDEVGAITADDLNPSIDITDKGVGEYNINVTLVEPVEGSISTKYTVKVVISEKAADVEPEPDTEPGTEDGTESSTEQGTSEVSLYVE